MSFRFDYEYDYEIRHLLASSPADVIKWRSRRSFEDDIFLKNRPQTSELYIYLE